MHNVLNFGKLYNTCYNTMRMNGVLLLNKPSGMTSFQAVNRCRNILHEKKAGHSGTLDPNASGLMILFFGKYTKLVPYCVHDHKHYQASFIMGKKTDTQDIWGNVIAEREPHDHTDEEIHTAVNNMLGDIEQIPPMYSALKKDGHKLYEYARKGITVERKPRKVHVSYMQVSHDGETWHMDTVVSSGTYIRTLIEDFCAALGEFGCMSALTRTGIEDLKLSDALSLEDVNEQSLLKDPKEILDPAWHIVPVKQEKEVRNGKALALKETYDKVILTSKNGEILASYEKKDDGLYHCVRGLY